MPGSNPPAYWADSFVRKKIAAVVCKNPKADRNDVARELRSFGYRDITGVGDELGLDEKKNLKEKLSQLPMSCL